MQLLAMTRRVRREVAIAKLGHSMSAQQLALTAVRQAGLDVELAIRWRSELSSSCALGQRQAMRESVLPGCDALLHLRGQQLVTRQIELRVANEQLRFLREEMTSRERDALRVEEWRELSECQARRERARREDLEEEESAGSGSMRQGARLWRS